MKTKAYTRGGDAGETSLYGGRRVSKDDARLETIGELDELNSLLGLALSLQPPERVRRVLAELQERLFELGADFATPLNAQAPKTVHRFSAVEVEGMEREIDALNEELPELHAFILPGGTQAASVLHVARNVARRAERSSVALSKKEGVNPQAIRYLNRLSSLLFVLARTANALAQQKEDEWRGKL